MKRKTKLVIAGAVVIVVGYALYKYLKQGVSQPQETGPPQINPNTGLPYSNAIYAALDNPDPGCPTGVVQGCNIPEATNYNPCVNWPTPATCTYPPGVVAGCMNPNADNYNPLATVNIPAQCVQMGVGCKDPAACNYNPEVQFQQAGTCIYPAGYDGGTRNNCGYDAFMGYAGQLTDYSPCITCEDYNDPSYMGPL